jgi:hypothetical protein
MNRNGGHYDEVEHPEAQRPSAHHPLVCIAAHDGLAVVPENVPAARVKKAVAKLTALGFVKEVRVKHDQPLWWTDDEGKRVGLKITTVGAAAIGVAEDSGSADEPASEPVPERRGKAAAQKGKAAQAEAGVGRGGSKRAQIIALMQRKAGATLDDMVEATGWLPHTTRAALTGLRHKAFDITKSKEKGGKTVYRLSRAGA